MTTADGRPVRLFELFHGPHWTLLAFGTPVPDLRFGPALHGYAALHAYTVVRPGEPAGTDALVDTDGHARAAYDMADGTLALVRPDGYLGLVTTGGAERVAEYRAAVVRGSRP